jgi:hypothetical protein
VPDHPIAYLDLEEDPLWFISPSASPLDVIEAVRSCLCAEVNSQESVRELDDRGELDIDEIRVALRSDFGIARLTVDIDGSSRLDLGGLSDAGRRALQDAIRADTRFTSFK